MYYLFNRLNDDDDSKIKTNLKNVRKTYAAWTPLALGSLQRSPDP